MIEPEEALEGTPRARRLAAAYDRTSSLISMVFTGAFTLLMAPVTFRVAMAGEWYGAAVSAVLAAGLGIRYGEVVPVVARLTPAGTLPLP